MYKNRLSSLSLVLSFGVVGAACSSQTAPLPPPPPPQPLPRVTAERTLPDHREVDIRFEGAEGAELEGTLYLPAASGLYSTVVLQGGSSWTTRATWEQVSFAVPVLGPVFDYDRRSFGASGGACCPSSDEDALYQLLAEDLAAAAEAMTVFDEVDPNSVGFFAMSQGGWTAPIAASIASDLVSFLIIAVGGALSTGQEALYDDLTGYSVCQRTATSIADINQAMRDAGPSGFDPRPSLETLTQPTLWLYGGMDWSHPAEFSTELLGAITASFPKDWTIVTLPDANHDLIDNGEICEQGPATADVFTPIMAFLDQLP